MDRRVPVETLLSLAGLKASRYKTARIRHATLDGVPISPLTAEVLMNDLKWSEVTWDGTVRGNLNNKYNREHKKRILAGLERMVESG